MTSHATTAIVIGANGGIGNAVFDRLLADESLDKIIGIGRQADPIQCGQSDRTTWLQSDSSEASISKICQRLTKQNHAIKYLIIATGVLHQEANHLRPEKRINALTQDNLDQVFSANTFVPMLWLKGLTPLFSKESETQIAVLSARVGSISDNKLGGWYSYRASKAALNMLLKTLAIEFRLRFPNIKITAFHPGTTDTPLSKPFQAHVPSGKLFTPNFVADKLYQVLNNSPADGALSFVDYDQKSIEW